MEQAQASEYNIYRDHVLTFGRTSEMWIPLAQISTDDGFRWNWLTIQQDIQAAFGSVVEAVAQKIFVGEEVFLFCDVTVLSSIFLQVVGEGDVGYGTGQVNGVGTINEGSYCLWLDE